MDGVSHNTEGLGSTGTEWGGWRKGLGAMEGRAFWKRHWLQGPEKMVIGVRGQLSRDGQRVGSN